MTGAAGFLGSRLVGALLSGRDGLPHVSRIVAADRAACPMRDPRVECRTGSITDGEFITSIVDHDVDMVYHMAAVLSGQAEAEFDLGMHVNFDATRSLLEACRRLTKAPRFVFTSSVAVFGGSLPGVVPEDMAPLPQSSYGAEKAMAELLVNDYSRRGFIDGIACRLALWITSPELVTNNLVHAAILPASALAGRRLVNLPGLCVTAGEMLASLERLGGATARARVRCEPDQRMVRIVCSWPGALDVSRPLGLGFTADRDIDSVVRQFMAERR